MPRINLPAPEAMDADQRRVYDKIVSGRRGRIVGPLRAALHNPELADRWQALGELLRYQTSLSPRISELAILVTGRACNAPFEWHVHRGEAEKAGIEQAIIEALLRQEVPQGLNDADETVILFARQLNQFKAVGDAVYDRARRAFGDKGVVELVALVGYYTLVAMTLNSHHIALPDGAAPAFPWPQPEPEPA